MNFQQIKLQFDAAMKEGNAIKLAALLKAFRETRPQSDQDVKQCVEILQQCTALQPCDLCDGVINLIRDVLLQVRTISDRTYFEVIMLRNELQLAKKAATTYDFDKHHIELGQFGRLLTQMARFKQDTEPLASVSQLRLALALKENVMELLIPLSIFTGNLSNLGLVKEYGFKNDFVEALLYRDYAAYEQLLSERAIPLVQAGLYSYYARGLLMIKKLCLDSGEMAKLPPGKRDRAELQQQTQQILCGSQIVPLQNVMQPKQLQIEKQILEVVRTEDAAMLQQMIQQLNQK